MDVSSVSTQSTAVAAYAAQLTARERTPASGGGIEDPGKTPAAGQASKPSSDEVTLSAEARRLATPESSESSANGEQPSGAANTPPARVASSEETPEGRASTAKSVAQAINAYLETSAV